MASVPRGATHVNQLDGSEHADREVSDAVKMLPVDAAPSGIVARILV